MTIRWWCLWRTKKEIQEGRDEVLEKAIELIGKGVYPDQFVFNLNEDKKTYSVDCIFNCINVNGENKSVTFHSDKTLFPKYDLLMTTNREENVLFDFIVPSEDEA